MPTLAEYASMPVRITRDLVYIGDEKIPGCIARDGIILKPGQADEVNRLTIEFFVGPVTADDPWVTTSEIAQGPPDPTIQYH